MVWGYIDDEIAVYMEGTFIVMLEDGSDRQVADEICHMYEGCSQGEFSLARQLIHNGDMVVSSLSVQGEFVHEGEDME